MQTTVPRTARPISRPSPELVRLDGLDADALSDAIRGGRFEVCQLDAGALQGELARVPLPTSHLDTGSCSVALGVRGVFPESAVTLLLIRRTGTNLRVNGLPAIQGDILICPPGARIQAVLPASTCWLALQVPSARARGVWAPPGYEIAHYRPQPTRRAAALEVVTALLDGNHGALPMARSGSSRIDFEAYVVHVLRTSIDGAVPIIPEQASVASRRREAIEAACDHMMDHLERTVPAGALCDVARVSPRTLAYDFRRTFGVSPMSWYRAQRFAAARRALLRTAPHGGSVTAVATRFGFKHLGRFSVEYRTLFAELPSETLSRRRRMPLRAAPPGRPGFPGERRLVSDSLAQRG